MSWMIILEIPIKLVGALCYTTMTGSIALAFWYLMGRYLEKSGYSRWYYLGLRVVTILFLVPVVYIAALRINDSTSRWHGLLFTKTPAILVGCTMICAVWGLGMAAIALKYAFEAWGLYRRNRNSIPCEKEKQELFDCICKELKIPVGRIRLRQNYRVITAEFMGTLHPQVLLPVKDFSREELRTVLLHELVHYQQRDIYLKYLAMLVLVIHYFNPMAWLLSRTVCKWSEYACDERACSMAGGPTAYFRNILSVAESAWQKKMHFTARMMEHKHELEERIAHMKKLNKGKKKSMVATVLLSFVVVASSSITVLAASDGLGRQYLEWAESTMVMVEAEPNPEPPHYVEYTDDGPERGITVERGISEQKTSSISCFEWTVPASTTKQTDTFYVSKGQAIKVDIYWNNYADKKLKVGIVKQSGSRTYVVGEEEISHDFSVDTSGYYQVFVQNNNSVAIKVEGNYVVR